MLMVPGKRIWPTGRIDAAFGRVGDDGRDQRVAEAARDRLGVGGDAHIVLADRHVGAVLLRAAGRNDDGGLSGRDRIADFLPGQPLQNDGVRSLRGRRRGKAKQRERNQISDHGVLPEE